MANEWQLISKALIHRFVNMLNLWRVRNTDSYPAFALVLIVDTVVIIRKIIQGNQKTYACYGDAESTVLLSIMNSGINDSTLAHNKTLHVGNKEGEKLLYQLLRAQLHYLRTAYLIRMSLCPWIGETHVTVSYICRYHNH